MNSIRVKLTLALLAMSFAAIAAVGITARSATLEQFDRLVIDRAFAGFEQEVGEYLSFYGSWEKARANESFIDFVRRTRPGPPSRPRGAPPPPSRGERVATAPPPGPHPRPFFLGGAPPKFIVVNDDGTVLLPLAGHAVGEAISSDQLASARPIRLDGEVIALAVALERPVLTEIEARYLDAIESSWMYSLLVAVALAIPLGLILAGRLSRPLGEMMRAIRAMQRGQLRQSVPVRSSDEVGMLAKALNRMSAQLADAYDELQHSHQQISQQAELLAQQSRRDELTGIHNRRAFDERGRDIVARARRYQHPLALALLDVDRFKEINDRFSHGAGDAVLRAVADSIQSNVRETDIVARYGGDEFAIAFPETTLEDASALADRVLTVIRNRSWTEIHPQLQVSLSIGLSTDTGLLSLEEMLQAADLKLYQAKKEGRDRVCV